MVLTENQFATLKRAMPAENAAEVEETRLKDGVIRFREDSGYNDSFALQWTEVPAQPIRLRQRNDYLSRPLCS